MGGRSTRVPNKLFLTTREGVPLFMHSLLLLRKVRVWPVLCLHYRTVDVVTQILKRFGYRQGTHYQLEVDTHNGITPTLNRKVLTSDLVVLCGDNTYGIKTERMLDQLLQEWTTDLTQPSFCFCVPSENEINELDGYRNRHPEGWVHRTQTKDFDLRTPWVLRRNTGEQNSATVLEFLNKQRAVPILVEDPEWNDLGTQSKVEEYYSGH